MKTLVDGVQAHRKHFMRESMFRSANILGTMEVVDSLKAFASICKHMADTEWLHDS